MNEIVTIFKELSFASLVEEARLFVGNQEYKQYFDCDNRSYGYPMCIFQLTHDGGGVHGESKFTKEGFISIVAGLKLAQDVFERRDNIDALRVFEDGSVGATHLSVEKGQVFVTSEDLLGNPKTRKTHRRLAHTLSQIETLWKNHIMLDCGFQSMIDRTALLGGFVLPYDDVFQQERNCSFQPMLAFDRQLEYKYISSHLKNYQQTKELFKTKKKL